jgi:hypothetical protein
MCISDPGQHLPSVTVDPTITRVDVTYFHETKRCQACINMEKWAYEVVVIDNKLYVDGGLLSFKSVDISDGDMMHIIDTYGACYTSLFINMIYDGYNHIVELDDVWLYSDDKPAYTQYVQEEISNAIGIVLEK